MINVTVHLSRIDDAAIAAHRHLLSTDEIAMAGRFLRKEDGELFSMGRVQRRLVLSEYLGIEPALMEFTLGEFGKPFLRNANVPRVSFNSSHCSGRVAVAVAAGALDIGVDIERLNRDVSDTLMHANLSAGEQGWLRTLPPPARPAGFMRLWTCKEAIMKASGLGLQLDPSTIDLEPEAQALVSLPAALGDPRDYLLVSQILPDGFGLATCVHGAGTRGIEVRICEDQWPRD